MFEIAPFSELRDGISYHLLQPAKDVNHQWSSVSCPLVTY